MLKVRGNRIDQAEIEQALIRLADVVHVAVITFERAEGVLSLAAHVVLTPGSERTITDLLPDAGISGKTDFLRLAGIHWPLPRHCWKRRQRLGCVCR